MAIRIPQALHDLNTESSIAFQQGLKTTPKIYAEYTKTIKSTKKGNTYAFLGSYPTMKKTPKKGTVARADMAQYVYTVDNERFDIIVPVDMDEVKDGEVDGTELGMSAAASQIDFLNTLGAQLLVKGYEQLCYDGQPMFDTEHPIASNVDGTGTVSLVSNIIGLRTATNPQWILMDNSRFVSPFFIQEREASSFLAVTNPDSADVLNKNTYDYKNTWRGAAGYGFWQTATSSREELNKETLKVAMQTIKMAKVDGGTLLHAKPTTLIVPASLEIAALELVKASANALGATNVFAGVAKVVVVPELD